MKTLKTIFILLALVCASSSFAQTKEETIAWIKGKFEKYFIGEEYLDVTIKDIKLVSIDACSFTVTSIGSPKSGDGKPHNFSNTFPTNILGISEYGYFFYGKDEKGKVLKKVLCESDGQKQYREAYMSVIKFFTGGEDNIRERMEKALKHLATFCEKKKETF